MKSLSLFDINGEPATIVALVKAGSEKLLEFSNPALQPKDNKLARCFILVAPDDVLNLTVTADHGTVDEFDLYVDGILRASQPNPDPQKKCKVTFKKVCYKGGPKAILKAYDMKVQPRTNISDFVAEDSINPPHVGSLVVKCWQKKAVPAQQYGAGSDSTLPNAKTHGEWFDLPANMVLDSTTPPSFEVGFANGRLPTKTKKTGKGLLDQLDDGLARIVADYELFAEMTFLLRSSEELDDLGFDDVPSRQPSTAKNEAEETQTQLDPEEADMLTKPIYDKISKDSSTKAQKLSKSKPRAPKPKIETSKSSPALLTSPFSSNNSNNNDRGENVTETSMENELTEITPPADVDLEKGNSSSGQPSTSEQQLSPVAQEQPVSEKLLKANYPSEDPDPVPELDCANGTSSVQERKSPILHREQKPRVWNKSTNNLTLKGYPNGPARLASLTKLPAADTQPLSPKLEPELSREARVISLLTPPQSSRKILDQNVASSIGHPNQPATSNNGIYQNVASSVENQDQSATSNKGIGGIRPDITSLSQAITASASSHGQDISRTSVFNALNISVIPLETVEHSLDGRTEIAEDDDIARGVESSRRTSGGASDNLDMNDTNTHVWSESPIMESQSFGQYGNFLLSRSSLVRHSMSPTLSRSLTQIQALRPILTEKSKTMGFHENFEENHAVARQLFAIPGRINSKRPAEEIMSVRPEKHRRLGESDYSGPSSINLISSTRLPVEAINGSMDITPSPSLCGTDGVDLSRLEAEYNDQVELNKRLTEQVEAYKRACKMHQDTESLRKKNKELAIQINELAGFMREE